MPSFSFSSLISFFRVRFRLCVRFCVRFRFRFRSPVFSLTFLVSFVRFRWRYRSYIRFRVFVRVVIIGAFGDRNDEKEVPGYALITVYTFSVFLCLVRKRAAVSWHHANSLPLTWEIATRTVICFRALHGS